MISQTKAWPGWIRDEQKYQVGFRKRLEGERKAVSGLGDVLVLVLMCSVCLEQPGMVLQEHTQGRLGQSFCEFPAGFPACCQLFLLSWSRGVRSEGLVVQGSLSQGLFKVQWDTAGGVTQTMWSSTS